MLFISISFFAVRPFDVMHARLKLAKAYISAMPDSEGCMAHACILTSFSDNLYRLEPIIHLKLPIMLWSSTSVLKIILSMFSDGYITN